MVLEKQYNGFVFMHVSNIREAQYIVSIVVIDIGYLIVHVHFVFFYI